MKTLYAAHNEEANSANDTADDHWREHTVTRSHVTGDIAVLVILLGVLAVIGMPWGTSAPQQREASGMSAQVPMPAFVDHSDILHSRRKHLAERQGDDMP